MDKQQEKEAMKRLEELKKKAQSDEQLNKQEENSQEKEIPREAFRKNMGCGG